MAPSSIDGLHDFQGANLYEILGALYFEILAQSHVMCPSKGLQLELVL